MVSTRATRQKNGIPVTGDDRPRIVPEGLVGSSENTIKLYTVGGLTKVGCASHRPAVLVGAECNVVVWTYSACLALSTSTLTFSVKRSETQLHRTFKLRYTLQPTVA